MHILLEMENTAVTAGVFFFCGASGRFSPTDPSCDHQWSLVLPSARCPCVPADSSGSVRRWCPAAHYSFHTLDPPAPLWLPSSLHPLQNKDGQRSESDFWTPRMFLQLTFSQLQVERVQCLLHVAAWHQAFHLVSQLLQLDVEMYFILCSRKLSASRAGRWHQVAHLHKVGEHLDLRYSVLSAMFPDSSGPVSTHRLSLWDSVGLQTKLQIFRLHTKSFFAEDFINAWKHKHMSMCCDHGFLLSQMVKKGGGSYLFH